MMCTILDAISNRKLARGKVAKTEEGTMVLHNSNGEVNVLLNVGKKFKLVTDDGSYSGEVTPWKKSKSYITVKISSTDKNDKRRYLRIPCSFKAKVYSCGSLSSCVVNELAYGSCILNCEEKLLSEEEATVQIEVNGTELNLNGIVKFEKIAEGADDDLWFSGYEYMISFEGCGNLSNTLDELYGLLLRMMQSERVAASEEMQA